MMNILVRLIAMRRPQVMVNPKEERQKRRRTADICHTWVEKFKPKILSIKIVARIANATPCHS